MEILQAFGLGLVTALATGLGVFPVYWARVGERGLGILWGISAGVMAAISLLDLIWPALDEPVPMGLGAAAGVAFVLLAAGQIYRFADDREEHEPSNPHGLEHAGELDTGAGHAHGHAHAVRWSSLSLLMFLVFTVHSGPEGVGIGSALRTGTVTGLVVVGAIALHNIPEGTAVAVGMRADGVSLWRAVGLAIVTSLPQPILAPLVFLVAVGPYLPAGMGFAGGAMLALVATEVGPEGLDTDTTGYLAGVIVGVAIGVGVNLLVPVPGGI